MYAKIQQEFSRRGALLMLGRHAEMATGYRFPLSIQLEGNVVVLRNTGQLIQLLQSLHRALLRRGVVQVQSNILAVELPRHNSLRIWTNWEEIGASPCDYRASDAIYSGQITPNGFMIDSINYVRLSMPELRNLYAPPIALSA
jgi:hypothetical protein